MPSSLRSFAEFDALLDSSRATVEEMLRAEPENGAIDSVHRQLDALHRITRNGQVLTRGEKDQFNFGAIASRELDDYPVAGALYELASFVMYW